MVYIVWHRGNLYAKCSFQGRSAGDENFLYPLTRGISDEESFVIILSFSMLGDLINTGLKAHRRFRVKRWPLCGVVASRKLPIL